MLMIDIEALAFRVWCKVQTYERSCWITYDPIVEIVSGSEYLMIKEIER